MNGTKIFLKKKKTKSSNTLVSGIDIFLMNKKKKRQCGRKRYENLLYFKNNYSIMQYTFFCFLDFYRWPQVTPQDENFLNICFIDLSLRYKKNPKMLEIL